ncbi:hypothetical protein [Scytonema sp. NUACC26]|uniref:hypothetical protein n=1 Tax=Scytonema sp. NUACC26 TaxID=3140176 RepID=UPI0034DC2B27
MKNFQYCRVGNAYQQTKVVGNAHPTCSSKICGGIPYIEGRTNWNLDSKPDIRVYKPDSLFMEAMRPSV